MFVPLTMSAAIHADYTDLESRRDHWLYLFGRLKPGMSREAAESSVQAVFSGIMQNIERPQFKGSAQVRDAVSCRESCSSPTARVANSRIAAR